jgi:hypothetical protein
MKFTGTQALPENFSASVLSAPATCSIKRGPHRPSYVPHERNFCGWFGVEAARCHNRFVVSCDFCATAQAQAEGYTLRVCVSVK